jgi:hypothetical protein
MTLAAGERIVSEVSSWAGIEILPHQYGGTEFRVGRRQLGHLHGDRIADLPLRRSRRDELIGQGLAREHRWRPNSGWVTIDIAEPESQLLVISLLRESYDQANAAQARRQSASAPGP